MTLLKRLVPFVLLFALSVLPTNAIGEPTPVPPAATPTPASGALTPDEVSRLLSETLDALNARDFGRAVELASRVLASDPANSEAYFLRGVAHNNMLRYQLAIDDFTRAIGIVPYDWVLYVFRGEAYFSQGETGEALTDFDKAIELNPRYTRAFSNRAFLYDRLGDRANATLNRLIAQGLEAYEAGDYVRAIVRLSDAIDGATTRNRTLAEAYYNRGLVNYLNGNLERAQEDYSAAADIAPQMHDPYLGRGIARREAGNLLGAGQDFLRRIEILESETFLKTSEIGAVYEVEMRYGAVYRFTFRARAGDTLTLSARDRDGVNVDPLIVLTDAQNVPLAGDDDFGGNYDALIDGFSIPADGEYVLVVSHANGGYDGIVRVEIRR